MRCSLPSFLPSAPTLVRLLHQGPLLIRQRVQVHKRHGPVFRKRPLLPWLLLVAPPPPRGQREELPEPAQHSRQGQTQDTEKGLAGVGQGGAFLPVPPLVGAVGVHDERCNGEEG